MQMRERSPGSAAEGEALLGTHLLVDGWNAPAVRLDDASSVRAAVTAAAEAVGATVIDVCVHRFSPRGVTAVATLAESHLAVHTWPELGYFAADLFYCGPGDVDGVVQTLVSAFGAEEVRVRHVPRGPGHGATPRALAPAGSREEGRERHAGAGVVVHEEEKLGIRCPQEAADPTPGTIRSAPPAGSASR
jgi:S-adenosylmethionine decarboxylase